MISVVPLRNAVLCADCDTIWNVVQSKTCPACAGQTFAPVSRPGREYRQILERHFAEAEELLRERLKSRPHSSHESTA